MFVGTDIENISRLQNLLVRKPHLVKKIFFESEWAYALTKANPASTLTGIWCAKEAVLKALNPILTLSINEIEIVYHLKGHPLANIHNAQYVLNSYHISISISHSKECATAVCVVEIT